MKPTFPHIANRILNEDLLDARRQLLADRATRLFARKGYHATTIDDIAGESGISVGSIYRYVGRKEDILLLIFRSLFAQYEKELVPILDLDVPPEEKLREAVHRYYKVIDKEPGKALIAYRESWALDDEGLAYVKQRELNIVGYFEAIIAEGVDRGVFCAPPDLNLVAYNVILLGHMWALKGWHFRHKMQVEAYADRQANLILDALLSKKKG